jgi:hypothetical protein
MNTANGNSISASTTADIAEGSLVLAVVHDGNAVTLSSVSGGGLSWSTPVNRTQGTVQAIAYSYGVAPSGGIPSGTTISGAFASAGTNNRKTIQLIEVTGTATDAPADAASSNGGGSVSSWNTGATGTLAQSGEIVFGFLGTGAPNASATSISVTASSPFSLLSQITTNATSTNRSQAVVYDVVSATDSVTPSGTTNQTAGWAGLTASFKGS